MGKCMAKPVELSFPTTTTESINEETKYDPMTELTELNLKDEVHLNQENKELIFKAFLKNHLFRGLTIENFEVIFKKLMLVSAEPGQFVVRQGKIGSFMFLISSGRAEVIVNNLKKNFLSKFDMFGEAALLSSSPRKFSIKALNKCSFWVLSHQNYFTSLKKLFSRSYDKFRQIISNSYFFTVFPDSQKDKITRLAVLNKFKNSETIINEGDDGNILFILKSGCVIFKKKGKEILRYSNPGDMFGEGALLTGQKRAATCISFGNTELISLSIENLENVFGEDYKDILLKNIVKNSIITDTNLRFLSKEDAIAISENLEWCVFDNTQVVIPSYYKKNSMLIIVCAGSLVTTGKFIQTIPSYQVIGFNNENENNLKPQDYLSNGKTIIGQITKENLDRVLGTSTADLFDSLDRVKFLKKVSIFRTLSLDSISSISLKMKKHKYKAGHKIFQADSDSLCIYIVKSGTVEIFYDSKIIRLVSVYESFGERCMRQKVRSASARCKTNSEIYTINRDDLMVLPEIKSLEIELNRRKYYQTDFEIYDMQIKNEIECNIGKRKKYCIKKTDEKTLYSLTIIPKNSLETPVDCYALTAEKEIMLQIEHRQIVKLVTTKNDDDNLYFITEHVKGKYLRNLLPLDENYLKIFTLYLISVLEYLHDKDIIYRNLCTDNIIISVNGLPFLQEFYKAKIINGRTYTRVGNPYYMSPEMIMGRGYTKSTDYWSLGVVLYETAYGYMPFNIKDIDETIVAYEKILRVNHGFTQIKSDEFNNLLRMLMKDSDARYGYEGVRKCDWLREVDWDRINANPLEGYQNEKFRIMKLKINIKRKQDLTVREIVDVIFI